MSAGGVASGGDAISTDDEENLNADPKMASDKIEVFELAISARRMM